MNEGRNERAGIGAEALRNAEMSVLGGCLLDPDAIVKVKDFLTPDMFGSWMTQTIFQCLLDLDESGQPVDFTGVTWWMDDHGHSDEIQGHQITELVAATPSSMHVEHYARLVQAAHRARVLEQTLSGAVGKLYEEEADVDAIQAWVQDQMMANTADTGKSAFVGDMVGSVVGSVYDNMEARKEGVQIGLKFKLKFLDQIVGGLRAGDLTILAARPGMGKTTMALQTILGAAEDGLLVFAYSLEMGSEQLVLKLVSYLSGVPYNRLRNGEVEEDEKVFIDAAADHLRNLPILIVDDAFTLEDIVIHARRAAMKHGNPYLIMVDYIQLATSDRKGLNGNQNALVSHISRTLKLLARSLDCPVLALSQLSRAVEQRGDKRPQLSDLRDSGSLEQDADHALFLYREGYYDEACETPNILEIIVRKNRHGGTGTASVYFKLETGQIRELEVIRTPLEY